MSSISIERMMTYPIKGLPGIDTSCVLLEVSGLAGDRRWAITSGACDIEPNGAWTPCQAFERLTITPLLAKASVLKKKNILAIQKAGTTIEFDSDAHRPTDAQQQQIKSMFGQQARLVSSSKNQTGYWDHADASVSIINLETVADIERKTGRKIDPNRFRGNLYVRATAWSEFSWLGKKLSTNGVSLSVIRPIDRCSATSVNPLNGNTDMNMPGELEKHFGHMYCGVYARVTEPGDVAVNQTFSLSGDAPENEIENAIRQTTAPNITAWPRSAIVTEIIEEAAGIKSLYFNDPLVQHGVLEHFKAGQYLRFHALNKGNGESSTWRSYSVSGVDDCSTRVTVKRESGEGSNAMHSLRVSDEVLVTGPFGEAVLKEGDSPLVLVSAGIGITPHMAIIRALVAQNTHRQVVLHHVAPSRLHLALWNELLHYSTQLSNIETHLHLTQEQSNNANHGRPNLAEITDLAVDINADLYCCGPAMFMSGFDQACIDSGVKSDRIVTEVFSTPGINIEFNEPALAGPFKVEFSRSGVAATWTKEQGTLLSFAENLGLNLPSHCRAGVCGSCKQGLSKGVAGSLLENQKTDPKSVLLCCSVPTENIVIDA